MGSILNYNKKLIDHEVTSEQIVAESIALAETVGKELNSFITTCGDEALEQARSIDNAGNFGGNILKGIPMSAKDNFSTKGIRSTGASQILANYVPEYDATNISRLKSEGAVMVGKNNGDPFGFGGSGENSGFGSTKNPVCTNRIPGGSSSGSAAAVAAGIVPYSLGTDTGGSIRQPAGMTGIVGLKASYGKNSRYGIMAMGSSWDTPGVLAGNVEDAFIVQNYLEGYDPKDGTTHQNIPVLSTADILKKLDILKASLSGKRIGVPKEFFGEGSDPEVLKVVMEAIRMYEQLGCEIVDISLPYSKYSIPVYYTVVPVEIASNVARLDGIRYGGVSVDESVAKSLEEFYLENKNLFESEIKRRTILGTYISAKGVSKNYYQKAMQVRNLIKLDFDNAFKTVDVIMTPTAPTAAWELGTKNDDPVFNYLADIFTTTASCAGIPAISVPAGFKYASEGESFGQDFKGNSCDKLPVGLQIIGKMYAEDEICNFAWQLENLRK